jgi:Zn-dependent protease
MQYLLFANISLVVFNMLPAFPMDGGRVLRAILSMRLPYARATQTAARVGKFVAVAIGLVGLVSGQFMLLFIAAFVILAGSAEANSVSREAAREAIDRSQPRWPMQSGRQVTVVWDESQRKYRVAGAG